MTADRSSDRDYLRELSKTLLGSRYQAEVGAAIADSTEPVWGKGLLAILGERPLTKGLVAEELEKLVEVDLLVSAAENPYDRRKLLRPADPDGSYWALCQELMRMSGS